MAAHDDESVLRAVQLPQAYGYDAAGIWVRLTRPDATHWRWWSGARVANELRVAAHGDAHAHVTWVGGAGCTLVEQVVGAGERSTLLASAPSGSVLLEADTVVRPVAYAPHGHHDGFSALATPGFNGEWFDPGSGCYLLGAGHHRPYSPALAMFLAPDAASPFRAGGLNSLAYCAGDPINRTDPSGHFWKWIGIAVAAIATVASFGTLAVVGVTVSGVIGAALGVAGLGVEIAAAAVKDEGTASILSYVGLGIGAAGLVAAAPAIAKSVVKLGQKFTRWNRHIATIRNVGLSGRGASRAGASLAQQTRAVAGAADAGASGAGDTVQAVGRATRSRFANETARELARNRSYPLLSELSDYGRSNAQANARNWMQQARGREAMFDFTQEEGLTSFQLGPDRVLARWSPNPPARAARTAARAAGTREIPVNLRPYNRTATRWDGVPPAYTDQNFTPFPSRPPAYDPGLPPPYPQGSPPPYNPNEFYF